MLKLIDFVDSDVSRLARRVTAPAVPEEKTSGQSRRPMKIKVGFEIAYSVPEPTPMIVMLNVHPSRAGDVIGEERVWTEPSVMINYYNDSFGNLCGRLVAPAGGITLFGDALVGDSGKHDPVVADAVQAPVEQLPDDVLLYLLPSRYCETDKLADIAWELFKDTPPGWARAQAINDYVHRHIAFDYMKARPTKTAFEVYREKTGVCRDFAHLAVAFCRCMNIPARYVNGYLGDIGVPEVEPMDYAAWIEVYLGGRWFAFDPRNNQPRIGRTKVAHGRDAADVPLIHSFGPHALTGFTVWCYDLANPPQNQKRPPEVRAA